MGKKKKKKGNKKIIIIGSLIVLLMCFIINSSVNKIYYSKDRTNVDVYWNLAKVEKYNKTEVNSFLDYVISFVAIEVNLNSFEVDNNKLNLFLTGDYNEDELKILSLLIFNKIDNIDKIYYNFGDEPIEHNKNIINGYFGKLNSKDKLKRILFN